MRILIAYGTIEGQTGKIAAFAEALLAGLGHEVVLFNTTDKTVPVSFDGIEKVVLAGSVHERRHPKPFELFISAHRQELRATSTLLLSISLSAAFPEGHEDAQDYLTEMKMRVDFEPDAELLVAGAVRADRYDYYAEQVVRHVVMRGRDYDRSVTIHEFTDWEALRATIAAFLEV